MHVTLFSHLILILFSIMIVLTTLNTLILLLNYIYVNIVTKMLKMNTIAYFFIQYMHYYKNSLLI